MSQSFFQNILPYGKPFISVYILGLSGWFSWEIECHSRMRVSSYL